MLTLYNNFASNFGNDTSCAPNVKMSTTKGKMTAVVIGVVDIYNERRHSITTQLHTTMIMACETTCPTKLQLFQIHHLDLFT